MSLMNRIYCTSFIDMDSISKIRLIERVRTLRSSALNAARVTKKQITKSAMRNISAKPQSKSKKSKLLKDPTIAVNAALAKLTPSQIAALAALYKESTGEVLE